MFFEKAIQQRQRIVQTRSHSPLVSVIKSISWRIIGTADTIMISYLLTGETKVAFGIGAIEVLTKMVLYYVHERIWTRISFRKLPDHGHSERHEAI